MASASLQFGNLTAGNGNYIYQGIQNAPLTSALERKQFQHGTPPPLNTYFLGREDEIAAIKTAFQKAQAGKQKRYVIYGMAGIGKSEICKKLFGDLQNEFWGLFWVDVSDISSAEESFKEIAGQIRPGTTHKTLGGALSALAEVDINTHPWLLILDNADKRTEDYARFFPSVSGGSIIITSRNHECTIHETAGCRELKSISFKDSVLLLFKASKLLQRDWEYYWPQAIKITQLLGSHTLALIHAGTFISRDVRNWHEYPKAFNKSRKHLLTTQFNQAQPRYSNVYASFEVSASALESDGDTVAEDALCLLRIFAMLHYSGFPTSVFEDASRGLDYARIHGLSHVIYGISKQLTDLLPALLSETPASNLRLQAGLHCLESLSFIKQANIDNQDVVSVVSMHPLIHAWAKDRLDRKSQEQAWMMTGSIIALSAKADPQCRYYYDTHSWSLRIGQLQSHIKSFFDNRVVHKPGDKWVIEHLQVVSIITMILSAFQLFHETEVLLLETFKLIKADPFRLKIVDLIPLYQHMAHLLGDLRKYSSSLDLWKQIVYVEEVNSFPETLLFRAKFMLARTYRISGATREAVAQVENAVSICQKKRSTDDPDLLSWQLELGHAYMNNGQSKKAIELLEHVVQIRQREVETSQVRLTSEHLLGYAYLENGQVQEAIELFEHIVSIQQRIATGSFLHRLATEHELGRAYFKAGRYEEALQLLENVAKIEKEIRSRDDPLHLTTLTMLPELYIRCGRPGKAKEVVVEFDSALRSLPRDDSRWRTHGKWLVSWKKNFNMEDESQVFEERSLDPASVTEPDSTEVEYGSKMGDNMPFWERLAIRIFKRNNGGETRR